MIIANLFEIYKRDVEQHGRIRGKIWAKRLTGVNENVTTGYAFEGEFIPFDYNQRLKEYDLKVGDLILTHIDQGSAKYHEPVVYVCKVTDIKSDDIKLVPLFKVVGRDWAKQILVDKEKLETIKSLLGKTSYKDKLYKLIDQLDESSAEVIYNEIKDKIKTLVAVNNI